MTLRSPDQAYRHLIWLSDLAFPTPQMLGLTAFMLKCNRMEWVIEVETEVAVPWTVWAHNHAVPFHIRMALDGAPGAAPHRWWVSEVPLDVVAIRKGADLRAFGGC